MTTIPRTGTATIGLVDNTSLPITTLPTTGTIGPDARTYTFIASWMLIIVLLVAASKTRIGYVIIYYSLLLIILLILVTEYRQITPLLNPITIGELEAQP